MGKPIHEELLEAGVRNAPEADSADEIRQRVVRWPRAIKIAGAGAAILFVLLEFFGLFAEHAFGGTLAFVLVVLVASMLGRSVKHERAAARPNAETEVRAAEAERDRYERVATDWNAHL